MRRNDDRTFFSVTETDQTTDGYVHIPLGQTVDARLLSVRCHEAQSQALPNQDYARIIYRQDDASLCFCVCDGVGSSYKGDFAAHYLATHLVNWLHDLSDLRPGPLKLGGSLHSYLNKLASPAQSELAALPFPKDRPPLVQEVLAELLSDYGSETVFLCGRLDYGPTGEIQRAQPFWRAPDPRVGRAFFCWMGNVSARLFTTPEHFILLGDTSDRDGRWSTLHGCRGTLRVWKRSLRALDRLVVYTDGCGESELRLFDAMDDGRSAQAQQLLSLPAQDDMTALEFHWQYAVHQKGTRP
jgi:hypothetical protein